MGSILQNIIQTIRNIHLSARQVIILAAAVCIALGLVLVIWLILRRKKTKEEAQHAVRRMREEALDRVLANPLEEKKAKPFEKKRRPFQVEYSKDPSHGPAEPVGKDMYQLTEITELSQRKYMFRYQEPVQIGNQFGNVVILPRNINPGQVYCQIFFYKNGNYLRSTGAVEVVLQRKGKTVIVNQNGLKLRSGDCFMAGRTSYQIEFIER